jgi:FK506-binding protein 2
MFRPAGGATLIFDTELVAVNGEPASKSDEDDDDSEL